MDVDVRNKNLKVIIWFPICLVTFMLFLHYGSRYIYRNLSYRGIVVDKYIDSNKRGQRYLYVQINDSTFKSYQFDNEYYFSRIEKGDFIIKDQGTLKHLLVKNGDTIIVSPNLFP